MASIEVYFVLEPDHCCGRTRPILKCIECNETAEVCWEAALIYQLKGPRNTRDAGKTLWVHSKWTLDTTHVAPSGAITKIVTVVDEAFKLGRDGWSSTSDLDKHNVMFGPCALMTTAKGSLTICTVTESSVEMDENGNPVEKKSVPKEDYRKKSFVTSFNGVVPKDGRSEDPNLDIQDVAGYQRQEPSYEASVFHCNIVGSDDKVIGKRPKLAPGTVLKGPQGITRSPLLDLPRVLPPFIW